MPANLSAPALAPFNCRYSAQIPELLMKLKCSIAISTYQAGKLIFLSPKDENHLVQLPRTFEKPMGIAENREKNLLALACKDEVMVFSNSSALATTYPKKPNTYDALFMPRLSYYTGSLDIHDLTFGEDDRLYAVNTLFSCLIEIDKYYSYKPVWNPPFIDKLSSEDRCHLNGMAMVNGRPKYVSAFGTGNTAKSWRETLTESGVVIDIDQNEIIAEGLPMPHTPRIFGDELYVLLSATGQLVRIDRKTGSYDVVVEPGGFVRGMALHKDYLFIAHSKLRKNSSTFSKLKIAKQADQAGIKIYHLPTASFAGQINYESSVDEIYDVHILADSIRPNILNTQNEMYKLGLSTPANTYWGRSLEK